MMFRQLAGALALSFSLSTLAPTAAAQWVDLSYGRATSHGSFNVGVSLGGCRPGVRADYRHKRAPVSYRSSGRYVWVDQRVWVAGARRQVWIPPVIDSWVDDCGTLRERVVREGYYEWISEPGRYETRRVKVWQPARGHGSFRTY